MIPGYLNDEVKITRVANSAVAAQTDVASSILDMTGFDGVMFIGILGDVTTGSVLELEVQQDDVNDTAGMAAITSSTFTAGASDADNKLLIQDVVRPTKRYVRGVLKRGTANAVVDGIVAIQYRARNRPTVHGSTVLSAGESTSPAEA